MKTWSRDISVIQCWDTGSMCPGRGWNYFSSPPRPDRLWGPPNLLSNGYQRLFLWGVKRPGREADHSPPSSAEDKNAWSYTTTPSIRLQVVVLRAQGQLQLYLSSVGMFHPRNYSAVSAKCDTEGQN
jgi:hypothetical protein